MTPRATKTLALYVVTPIALWTGMFLLWRHELIMEAVVTLIGCLVVGCIVVIAAMFVGAARINRWDEWEG